MNTLTPALVGALIGFIASFGAAMFTNMNARLQKEREVHSQVRRKVREINRICSEVDEIDNYTAKAARVDKLADDIDSFVFLFLSKADRKDLQTCVTAIEDRHAYGPSPTRVVRRAALAIENIVTARAEQSLPLVQEAKLSEGTKAILKDFRKLEELEEERMRLNAEDAEQARRDGII